jgi:hypothetical protein
MCVLFFSCSKSPLPYSSCRSFCHGSFHAARFCCPALLCVHTLRCSSHAGARRKRKASIRHNSNIRVETITSSTTLPCEALLFAAFLRDMLLVATGRAARSTVVGQDASGMRRCHKPSWRGGAQSTSHAGWAQALHGKGCGGKGSAGVRHHLSPDVSCSGPSITLRAVKERRQAGSSRGRA